MLGSDTMANPLFYNQVIPLDSVAHRNFAVQNLDRPLDFAGAANLIPALTEEFVAAAPHLPIAFLPGATRPAAVFVVGTRPGSNVFIDADGKWTGGYLPAYLRRYPFIMGDVPDGEAILCFDEASPALSANEGARLFEEGGNPTATLTQALGLAENYRTAALRSDAFCDALQAMGLLRSVTLDVKQPSGESSVVHGLLVLDEEAFDALSPENLARLHAEKWLKPLLAHLVSLAAIGKLSETRITA